MSTAFWVLLAAVIGFSYGWVGAHKTVATECERLGSFYVGKRVFKCVEITNVTQDKTE